jgi:putative chitinase
MNPTVFFDRVRSSFGKLNQSQVDGFNAILTGWTMQGGADSRWLAYMLATAWHETGKAMQPINELGGTDYFTRMYDPPPAGTRPSVAKDLGNVNPGDGARYHGRGYVQLTGRANYRKMGAKLHFDLEGNPELALDADVAEEIMFAGMRDGDFTGKKLSDYFSASKDDPVNARRIINGIDKAETIAGYHRKFLAAINAAEAADQPDPEPVPPPEPEAPPPLVSEVDETVWIRRADVAGALRDWADKSRQEVHAMADEIEGLA